MLRTLASLITPPRAAQAASPSSGDPLTTDPPEKSDIVDNLVVVTPPGNEGAGVSQTPAQPGAGANSLQQVMVVPVSRHDGEEESLQPESDRSENLQQPHDEAEKKTSSSMHRSSRMNEDTVGRSTPEGPDTSSQLENENRSGDWEKESIQQQLDEVGSIVDQEQITAAQTPEGQLNMMEIYKMMKKAAEMLNRAIGLSDVTQTHTQPLVFSRRPERWVINTMAVDGEETFTPAHEDEAEATEVKMAVEKGGGNFYPRTWQSRGGETFTPAYEDKISAGPIEKAANDVAMKAVEDTMFSMKNHEDFIILMEENKDFGDTTQIANRGSAARGHDRGLYPRRVEEKEEAHMKTNIEYEFYDVLSDETYNEVRWRGKPFEAFKDIMFVDGNYEVLMSEADRIAQSGGSGRNAHHDAIDDNARSDVTERKDRQSGVEDLIYMHACNIASGMEEREYEDDVNKDICHDGGLLCHHAASWQSLVVEQIKGDEFSRIMRSSSQFGNSMQSEVYNGNDAVNDRNDGLLCHPLGGALWHLFVEEWKFNSTRSTTEVKSISNERNGYPSEGSFIFLDKYGADMCCISEIEAIEEKFEDDDVHGPNSEALWYLSLKVKKKSTTLPPPSSITDDRKPDLESNASDSTSGGDVFDEESSSAINGESKSD